MGSKGRWRVSGGSSQIAQAGSVGRVVNSCSVLKNARGTGLHRAEVDCAANVRRRNGCRRAGAWLK
jgi:hypothetical protein